MNRNNRRGTAARTLCSGGLAGSRAFWASDFASASNWPCWVLGLACAMDDDGEVWLHRKKSKTKMPLMAAPLPAKRRALGAGTVKVIITFSVSVIMPPSALDRLASLHIEYPMLFEVRNTAAERTSHCGVLEFIAEEGMIYMPYWAHDYWEGFMRDYWEGLLGRLHTMRHGCFLIHGSFLICFLIRFHSCVIHGSFLIYFHARFPDSWVVLDLFPD
ncbi:hypothetical protein QYE76_047068 [Lolium multiflorum]|uniref:Ubiquitin fusion degradation protein UFD1 N-terminal subdomain 1 domain-containing protein n=1 Tax=Lolium multiflorum TaxID=4521 RepID=A0AAD8WZ90_LOLMU|nr:hypothetical protein QYE76_047068 [Lolium multiflorum]